MTADKEPWLEPLVLAISEIHPGNQAEAIAIVRAAYAELKRQGLIRAPGTVEVCRVCLKPYPVPCAGRSRFAGPAERKNGWIEPCPIKGDQDVKS